MMDGLAAASPRALFFRHSAWDAVLVTLALGHGVLLLCFPWAPLIAVGLWWNSNTISHCFIHKPYFSTRFLNAVFSLYLSVLLGVPQSLWRARHLAHHAGGTAGYPRSAAFALELTGILILWTILIVAHPSVFFLAYVPGYVCGLLLCQLHGHYEHARGTVSHHGRFYNWLFFNDGYHFEHHRRPQLHWTRLGVCPKSPVGPRPSEKLVVKERGGSAGYPLAGVGAATRSTEGIHRRRADADPRASQPVESSESLDRLLPREGSSVRISRWPPIFRWLEGGPLEWLERGALKSAIVRRFLLRVHRRALDGLLSDAGAGAIRRVGIVGGGLFPRTALILGELLPGARIRILDGSLENLERARAQLPEEVELVHAWYDGGEVEDVDLIVFPLAFCGDRAAVYESPPAPLVLVHDWMWRRRGASRIVSWLLLKRLNLVRA